MTLCGAYAAAAPEQPFPTTAELLEKLQEVLEKADVEVGHLPIVIKDQLSFRQHAFAAATELHQQHAAAVLLSLLHS